MYGRPKLIEFDKTRSPGYTWRVFARPSGFIFSVVWVIYRPSSGASPIFTQLSPQGSSVMYRSIGRGEPPLSISTSSESLRCSQGSVKPAKRICGTNAFPCCSAISFTPEQCFELFQARQIAGVTGQIAKHSSQFLLRFIDLAAYIGICGGVLVLQRVHFANELVDHGIR